MMKADFATSTIIFISLNFFAELQRRLVIYFCFFITSLYAEISASITSSFATLFSTKVVAPFSPHLFGTGKILCASILQKTTCSDGVRKILVGRGGRFVSYFRFEYARGERMVPHAHGKRQEVPQEVNC